MQYLLRKSLVFVLSAFVSVSIYAQKDDITLMMSDIAKKKSTKTSLNQSIREGKERALLCNQCHGADGISKRPKVPNLAGQNPVYLLDQIEKFADGRRKNSVMNSLSKHFTRDDKENLAIFYANLTPRPAQSDPKLAAIGKPIYDQKCSSCHGDKGLGHTSFARLAGQKPVYLERTLKRFKKDDKSSKRSNNLMAAIASDLSNDDIKALAAYIAQLK